MVDTANSEQACGPNLVSTPSYAPCASCGAAPAVPRWFGAFNDSISDCLVLYLDECTFGGDRKVAAQLKTLITEEHNHVNAKYLPSVCIENHMTVFVSTNEAWAVSVEESDRRQLVLELDNRYAGKSTPSTHAYFRRIREVPYQAIYKLLMAVDLAGFVPTVYPTTQATRTQKVYTMNSIVAWIHQSLGEAVRWTQLATVSKQDLYEDYKAHVKANGGHYGRAKPFSHFMLELGKVCGIVGVEGSRYELSIPPSEDMKTRLRSYMNDEGFPV